MSGRALRRLPVLAHARYGIGLNAHAPKAGGSSGGTEVESWLNAMERVIEDQNAERARMER
jgi:hypothetical protein